MNYYRQVSKYELDNNTVNWQELKSEKSRQDTYNASLRKKQGQGQKSLISKDRLTERMKKIETLASQRKEYLEET
jgi:flagellar motility protein MotE (MotC chaperone)